MSAVNSHTVTILVVGRYVHGGEQKVSVEISGDGGIEHMLDSFRAALVAAGFDFVTASRLDIREGADA